MRKRGWGVLIAAVVVAATLIGCSQKSSSSAEKPKVTLRFATQSMTDATGVVTKGILSDFMAKNPNVTISIESYPGNDLITAINTEVMAGNTPDVFTFWRPESGWNVPSYAKAGALANLTALSKSPALKDLFPAYAWRTASEIDGIVYCIPRTSYYDEFVVNKALFNKYGIPLPATWADLVSGITALKSHGIIPWVNTTGALLDDSSRLFFNILNNQVGNQKALDLMEGKASWLQPDVMPALQAFVTVAANNGPPDQAVLSTTQAISKYLNTGKAAMMLDNNGQINSNISKEALPDMVPLPFPVLPGGVEKSPTTEADVTNLVYASAKAYADPAKKPYIDQLIIDLVDKKAATAYVEQAGLTVPQLGLTINQALVPKFIIDANEIANKEPGQKWLLSFVSANNRSTFRDIINKVWYGTMNAQQLRDALQSGLYGKTS